MLNDVEVLRECGASLGSSSIERLLLLRSTPRSHGNIQGGPKITSYLNESVVSLIIYLFQHLKEMFFNTYDENIVSELKCNLKLIKLVFFLYFNVLLKKKKIGWKKLLAHPVLTDDR